MKNKKCMFEKWCGTVHCENCTNVEGVCGNCEHYVQIDSAHGHCFGCPPVRKYRLAFFGLKYEEVPKIVPWCMVKCGVYKKNKKRK